MDLNLSQNRLQSIDFLQDLKHSAFRVLRVDSNPFAADSEASLAFANIATQFKGLKELSAGL